MMEECDVIIIGAGFGGVCNLIHLRQLGLRCKLIEAEADFGGVWQSNRYPGARVDSDIPFYEFSLPEIWKSWTWSEKFPGQKELHAYFAFVDDKFDLRKNCRFNSFVKQACWNDRTHIWHVTSHGRDGTYRASARHLILCTGFASKLYIPEWKGLETFQGVWAHTARWPDEGIETKGKRIGVIGTGASGVQVIQEFGQHAGHLTVFQRTPNLAVPMRQCRIEKRIQNHFKSIYEEIYRKGRATPTGFTMTSIPWSAMRDSEEEREKILETLWEQGGFTFLLSNYEDVMINKDSNDVIYSFWRKKIGERIKDPRKRELLAPTIPPHPFASKRPSLEQHYYEIFNQDNVDIADLNANPIIEITPKGVRTTKKEYEFDVLIFATGFDTLTGGFTEIDLRGESGKTIQDHWRDGTLTYLGITIDNFPNLFYVYGPQAPTAFVNAPTLIETQVSWIAQTINYLQQHCITKFMPTPRAALTYKKHVNEMWDLTLYSKAKGWYSGENIPGKSREAYNYVGGLVNYRREITEEIEHGYPGFQKEVLTMSRL